MKTTARLLFVLVALTACSKMSDGQQAGEKEDLVFEASSSATTRTTMDQDRNVLWTAGDEISLFSSSAPESNERFTCTDVSGSTGEFSGRASRGKTYHAVYPFRPENRLEGKLLYTRINPEQQASAGSFSDGQNLSVAVSDNQKLQFHNVCAPVAFTIPETGSKRITKAVLKGNEGEKLCGNVHVDMSSSHPVALTDKSSVYKATLTGNLEEGKTYYLITAPQDFKRGVSLTLYTDTGESFVAMNETPLSTTAGKILTLQEFNISTDKDIQKEGNTYHIYTAEGLSRFAEIVNGGETEADAILENDIDLDGISSWEPIGKGTVRYETVAERTNTAVISGTPYRGNFDGNGKTVWNLKILAEGAVIGNTTGFFGILDQANVKNLTLGKAGDASLLSVRTSGSAMQETGVLAGLCHESDITGVTSFVKVSYRGSSTKRVTVGMIGSVHSDKKQSILERVVNRADFDIACSGNETNRWGTAIHVGGICGAAFSAFENGNNSSNKITFLSYCENYGNITSNSGRVAGIAGAAPYYTVLNSCFNHGTIKTSNPVTGYAAGMTVYMSTMSGMQDCINNGNVIATDGAGVAGLVGLASYNNSNFSACANFGDIISDNAKRGVFVSTNSAASRWMGCTAAGHVGTYNNNSIQFDSYPEAMQIKYLGPGAESLNLDGIIYQIGATEIPEGPEAKLRILFIGNSFTQDAVHLLPDLLEGAGIKDVELGLMYWGGSTIQQHDEAFYSNSTNFTYYRKPTSVDRGWLQYKGYTLEDALKEHAWDVVTIQEHTGRPQSWIWSATEKEAINGLISKVSKTQTGDSPEIWYIFSQAYHDLTKSSGVRDTFSSTEEHYAKIAAQARTISQEITSLNGIIPTGTVLQNLRGSSLNNDLGLSRDGYHMDWSLSRYAAACAVYECLVLKHYPTATLETNTYRNSGSGTGRTPVTDQNRPLAINAARKAIEKPFEVSPIE